jgi:hypothetical protein
MKIDHEATLSPATDAGPFLIPGRPGRSRFFDPIEALGQRSSGTSSAATATTPDRSRSPDRGRQLGGGSRLTVESGATASVLCDVIA